MRSRPRTGKSLTFYYGVDAYSSPPSTVLQLSFSLIAFINTSSLIRNVRATVFYGFLYKNTPVKKRERYSVVA